MTFISAVEVEVEFEFAVAVAAVVVVVDGATVAVIALGEKVVVAVETQVATVHLSLEES